MIKGNERRGVVYARVSSEDQAASGLGVEAQVAACREHAAGAGLEVVGVAVDEGVSGMASPLRRAGFSLACELARRERAGVVLALNWSRVTRQPEDRGLARYALAGAGARLELVEGDVAPATDLASLAHRFAGQVVDLAEARRASERTKAPLAAKRARGEWVGGRAPYGYRWATDEERGEGAAPRLVVDPEELRVVARVRALAASGHSRRAIARALNDAAVRSRLGRSSSATTIGALIDRDPPDLGCAP